MVKLKPAKEYLRDFFFIRKGAVAFQENDIFAAIDYLNRLAEKRGQPLVPVSYTHLDVYKRQDRTGRKRCDRLCSDP